VPPPNPSPLITRQSGQFEAEPMYTLEAALGWLCGASLLEEKKPRSRWFATPLKPSGATGVAYRTPPLPPPPPPLVAASFARSSLRSASQAWRLPACACMPSIAAATWEGGEYVGKVRVHALHSGSHLLAGDGTYISPISHLLAGDRHLAPEILELSVQRHHAPLGLVPLRTRVHRLLARGLDLAAQPRRLRGQPDHLLPHRVAPLLLLPQLHAQSLLHPRGRTLALALRGAHHLLHHLDLPLGEIGLLAELGLARLPLPL
jgi:hypothetical protein